MDGTPAQADKLPTGRRSVLRSNAIQTLLAFGALIVMLVVFSIASPNFLSFDNITVFDVLHLREQNAIQVRLV